LAVNEVGGNFEHKHFSFVQNYTRNMKKTLTFLFATAFSLTWLNAQTLSYPFTNGSLAGLTQYGTALTQATDRINSPTDAIDLNGDYLRSGSFTTTNLSLSFWVRTTTQDGAKRIIIEQSYRNSTFDNASDGGWYTYLKNGKVGLAANYWHTHDYNGSPQTNQSGYYYTEGTTNLADGFWHNVVVTAQKSVYYQNSWMKRYTYAIYIDGVLENSQNVDRGSGSSSSNINAVLIPTSKPLTIANNNSSNLADRYLDEIDDIEYYNYALNASQVSALANVNNCAVAENITISAITNNSATIDWDSHPNTVDWNLIYVESGQPMNNGTLVSGISANTYNLTGLTMNTTYDVYVQSNCSGYSGWWSLASPFTTLCPSSYANAIAQNITVQLDVNGSGSITVNDIDNGSNVECGVMDISIDKTNFDCSEVGANTVTLTVTDNQGHISTATSTVTVLGIINDEDLTPSQTNICAGSSVTISTASSMTGIQYYLRNDATNTVIGTPQNGTGSALTFNTGAINSDQTFNILAEPAPNKLALDFDGTNDLVTTNVSISTTNTLTIETWLFPRSNNYDRIISNYSAPTPAGQIVLDTYDANNNGKGLRFYVVGTGNYGHIANVSNVLTLNAWNHVAATFDNGVLKLYVNGVLKTTTTAPFTTIPGNTNPFILGEDYVIGTVEYLNGKLDDIRIWNTARSASEIAGNMNNCLEGTESGLQAYFKISEGTGNTITDIVNGATGTLTNMDSATDWVTGTANCTSGCQYEMIEKITITTNDTQAPVATVPSLSGLTAQCSITTLTAPTASDNCAGTITGTTNTTLPITSTTTITWTYNDGNGNTSTQTQTVTINDNVAPVPSNTTLSDVVSQCSVTSLSAPTAVDNCVGTVTGTTNATLPITASTTITWTYSDGKGNASTQTQNIIVNDNIAPVPNSNTLSDLTAQCEIASLTAPTAADNCMGTITGTTNTTLPITASTTITWTYDDGNGNTSTQTQNIIVNDNIAPVPNSNTLSDLTAQCEIASLTAPTASDNCMGTITGTTNTTLPITASTTITWTYDDGNGNTSTQTQNIIVNDNIAPVPNSNTLSDLTAQCEIASLTAPTASDNCMGTITGTTNTTLPISNTTTITWTFDDGNGNTSTQTQEVIINDITSPVPDQNTLSTVNEQCELTSITPPTATDNCSGLITGTTNTSFPISSTTTITWTFDDGNGNSITQDQDVIINDNLAPVPDYTLLSDIIGICEINSITAPTATDNCSGLITATHNTQFPILSNTVVTWTFDDGNGNVYTEDQNVQISAINANVNQVDNTITASLATADAYQWIDCSTNLPMTGETNQSFTANTNGTYAVQITIGSCTETSICTTIQGIGIKENQLPDLIIAPNPTLDILTIQTEMELIQIELYNSLGEVVLIENKKSLSLGKFAPGVYMLKTTTNQGVFQNRIIKN
jgi:D-ribose pyranose/furanose isomerase RbsD